MAAPTLTRDQIAALAYQAGFRGQGLANIVAIALAESGGDPQAYNPETAAGTAQGKGSVGLTQIYQTAHPQYGRQDLEDPLTNLQAAYAVSNGGQSFTPWSTWNNGAAQRYLTDGMGGLTMGRNQAGDPNQQLIQDAIGDPTAGATAPTTAPATSADSGNQGGGTALSHADLLALFDKHGGVQASGALDPTITGTGNIRSPNPSPKIKYTLKDGTTLTVRFNPDMGGKDGAWDVVDPGTAFKSPAGASAKQVGTNTRDAYITTVDKDGNPTTIPNPNYQPPATTVNAGSADPYIISRKADGSLVSERNPNYVAPTQVGGVPIDDAIKTAQLLRDNLALQVEQGRLTNETAAQHFSQWWQINVDYPLKLHEQKVAEISAAQTASRDAQDVALRSLPFRVGPNFGADFAKGNATLSGGGGKITYSPDDFTFDMPNFNQIGQAAADRVTAQFHPADRALAAISPTAAANVGAPAPNVAAIPGMAATVPYVPPGAAPVAAGPVATPYVGSGMRDRG